MILFPALLLWRPFATTWQALWIERWMLVVFMAGANLIWSAPLRRRIYPWALTYFLGLAAWGASRLDFQASAHLLCWMAFLILLQDRHSLGSGLKWSGIACAVACLASGWHANQVWPLSNPSMTGTFVALALAAENDWSWFLGLAAVLFTGRHIPEAAWLVMTYWSRLGRGMPIALFWIIGGASVLVADSERLFIWQYVWGLWVHADWPRFLFGAGAGITAPILATVVTPQGQAFIWAHQDWLQIGFEYGLVGLLLALVVAYRLFQDSPRKNQAVLLGFGISMFGNFPLHWPMTALALWINSKEGLLDTLHQGEKAGATWPEHGVLDGQGECIVRPVSDHCRPWRGSLQWH